MKKVVIFFDFNFMKKKVASGEGKRVMRRSAVCVGFSPGGFAQG